MMLAVLDLGIANTLTNSISQAYAERSEEMAKLYYATVFWATSTIAVLLGLLSTVIWPHSIGKNSSNNVIGAREQDKSLDRLKSRIFESGNRRRERLKRERQAEALLRLHGDLMTP